MPVRLTGAERYVVKEVCAGRTADLSRWRGGKNRHIRGFVIRDLVLGRLPLPPQGAPRPQRCATVGVYIHNAEIDGPIDLRDAAPEETDYLPALELIDCDIPEMIDVTHARLQRLSLRDSRIVKLDGRRLRLAGNINLEGVSSWETARYARDKNGKQPAPTGAFGEGCCWVRLSGARIGGNVLARAATLCVRALKWHYDLKLNKAYLDKKLLFKIDIKNLIVLKKCFIHNPALTKSPYALNLSDADIGGSVQAEPFFQAIGGVTIANARIGGAVWMQGATLRAYAHCALNGQTAGIDGALVMRTYSSVPRPREYERGTTESISYKDSRVTQLKFKCASRAEQRAEQTPEAKSEFIAEYLRFTATGDIWLLGARIGSDLDMSGGSVSQPENITPAHAATQYSAQPKFVITGARIGRNFMIWGVRIGEISPHSKPYLQWSEIADGIAAQDAVIGGNLFGRNAYLGWAGNETGKKNTKSRHGIMAPGLSVKGELDLWNSHTGRIDLDGAKVGSDLKLGGGSTVYDPKFSRRLSKAACLRNAIAINCADIEIGEDLTFEDRNTKGQINLRRARINGTLRFDHKIRG